MPYAEGFTEGAMGVEWALEGSSGVEKLGTLYKDSLHGSRESLRQPRFGNEDGRRGKVNVIRAATVSRSRTLT